MGNDIARQFAHLPTDEAVSTISAHIVRFWTPSMRARLSAQAMAGDDSLDPLLAAAADTFLP
jgi:formate dehydrogenase subunit delta